VDVGALEVFQEAGVEGAFVLLDVTSNRITIANPELAERAFLPASTFKIPNTLIGLETGVIPDESFALEWDGVDRGVFDVWNRDHDLRSAMKNSVLWFYQELARRIGEDRYHDWMSRLDYGNRDIGGGVDQFWVAGDLRITPREQVRFLRRLLQGDLPVEERSVRIVRDILLVSQKDGVTLRAKTGLTAQTPHYVGWLVGFVERPAGSSSGDPNESGGGSRVSHIFATLVLGPADREWRDSPVFDARRTVPLRLLERAGAVPPDMPQPR
jgi:beta-lactamase class D